MGTSAKTLYEVNKTRDSDKFSPSDVPTHIDDVNDPNDEVVLQRRYSLEDEVRTSGSQSFPRYQLETEEPLSMGDAPPIVSEPQSD